MLYFDRSSRYEKIYMPKFLPKNKNEVEHYEFIKTVNAGSSKGHIFLGANEYIMSLSKSDNIKVEERSLEPVGFRRKTIEELEILANKFQDTFDQERKIKQINSSSKYSRVVKPPVLKQHLFWTDRMVDKYLINVVTGEEIHLAIVRRDIINKANITNHLLDCIIRDGLEANNWTYKGERLDGKSWEEYFKAKSHYKTNFEYVGTYFTKDNKKIPYKTLRSTAFEMGISHETLRLALKNNQSEVFGYKIIKEKTEPESPAQS